MLSFWAGGISSFPPCAREYRLLRRLERLILRSLQDRNCCSHLSGDLNKFLDYFETTSEITC